ncbi:MAG: hypothetical protein JWO67_3186 [Streptosporangiaceae bacterium]|nr:hypothetical protein [Streptosporangiaceae bacterium]
MKVNSGQDKQALCLAGGTQSGYVNTSGAITYATTTVTPTTSPAWTTNQWAGKLVVAGAVYGVIVSNTATALTIDRWYNPANPTGTAGTTPAANTSFLILGAAAPVNYMAITTNNTAPAATDTALASEWNVASGGLNRQVCTYAHTLGASSYTLTATFTANSTDVASGPLPGSFNKMATFDSATSATGVMLHESSLPSPATLSAAGDAVTITQTVNT